MQSTRLTLKQGTKLELPLTINRLYGFTDLVQTQFLGAYEIAGISSPLLSLPTGETGGRPASSAGQCGSRHICILGPCQLRLITVYLWRSNGTSS